MGPEDRAALFLRRTHHRRIVIGAADTETGSRIGGRAPAALAAPLTCPRSGDAMEYFVTMTAADIGAALDVSILYCRSFDCLLEGSVSMPSRLRSPSPLAVVAHADSPRGPSPGPNDSSLEGRALVVGASESDPDAHGEPAETSKVGGEPCLLQRGEGLAEFLAGDGLGFLFQLSELDYPKGMNIGTYRFSGGTLYVFGVFTTDGQPKPPPAIALWQHT